MEDQTFTVAIHIGNDAMRSPEDVARALRTIADKLDRGATLDTYQTVHDHLGTYQTIHDDNGNDVGRWKFGYADRVGHSLAV